MGTSIDRAAGGLTVACLLYAISLPTASAAGSTAPAPPAYQAGAERIELEILPDLVTLARSPGTEDRTELLASLGPEGTRATATPLSDEVWLVDLTRTDGETPRRTRLGAEGGKESVEGPSLEARDRLEKRDAATAFRQGRLRRQRAVIEATLDDPRTEWAYPAHRNPETGTVLLLTPRIVVAVEAGIDETRLSSLLPRSVRLVRALRSSGQYLLELTDPRRDDPLAVAARLAREEGWVRWAEPDFVQKWHREATPNDPLFPDQWHLENTGQGGGLLGADARLPGAWDVETGDGSVVIAVLDDGVEIGHPDLPIFNNPGESTDGVDNDGNGYVDDLQGWDFFSGDNDPDPCSSSSCSAGVGSHGTAVAGVAAASGNDGTGVTGACQNCRILPVRIADHASGFFTSNANIADAIDYAGDLADVLNNSWGGGSPSMAITTAIQGASSSGRGGLGAPVFFASGNSASAYQTFTLTGIPAGTYTFTWTFSKDATVTDGLDAVWLDDVLFQDGTLQTFEGCSGLPTGWSTAGDASWTAVDDGTRAHSLFGGHCSIGSGSISHSESTSVSVTKSFASSGDLVFSLWRSSEPSGPLTIDDQSSPPECYDYVELTVFDGNNTFGPYFRSCGTYSNQGNPLQDGAISYPASVSEAIAVGAATNHDTRSDYGQWEAGELDFLCHSNGGTLGITTTDLTGSDGYSSNSYTGGFGGTSSASPLCAGIGGLILTEDPGLTSSDVRSLMQASTRKVGDMPYSGGRNAVYGYGAVNADLALQAIAPDASIVVEKRTIPEGDPTSFSFTGDVAGSIADGQQLSAAVSAGAYSSTEMIPAGWSLFGITCDDEDSTVDVGSATARFQVDSQETVTCVFLDCSNTANTTLDLSGVTVTSGMTETYEACDTLTADTFEAQGGSTVTFRAGGKIVLEDGVAIGGAFTAEIAGQP